MEEGFKVLALSAVWLIAGIVIGLFMGTWLLLWHQRKCQHDHNDTYCDHGAVRCRKCGAIFGITGGR